MKKERIAKLRLFSEADVPVRVGWMNDERVYPFMGFIPPISIDNTNAWLKRVNNDSSRVDLTIVNATDEIVAFGGITAINNQVGKGEFYIFVNPDMHHQGYGKLSTIAICQYAFMVLNLHKIYLIANESNIPARNMYESIGFIQEGRMRDEKLVKGVYENRIYYGLLKTDFKEGLRLPIFTTLIDNILPPPTPHVIKQYVIRGVNSLQFQILTAHIGKEVAA